MSLLILPMVLMVSCTDLDDVNQRLDEHEARLEKLELLVTDANSTIDNLKMLVDAQGKKVSVVSYEALPNGAGYLLKMSDGTVITLKNGSDGQSPTVGVKEVDGVLYWTINGETMRDADGNPIKAKGEDGETGQAPKIRVNTDGQWEVSLDGGKTWQAVLDGNGNPVNAVGSDAEVDLTITETENAIIIVYDGQTFIIPKGNASDPIDVAITSADGVYKSGDSYGSFNIGLNSETIGFNIHFISDIVADSDLLNAELKAGTYSFVNPAMKAGDAKEKFTIATDSYILIGDKEIPIATGELNVEYQANSYTIEGVVGDAQKNTYKISYTGPINIEPEYDVVYEKQNGWYWGDNEWDHPGIAEYMSYFVKGKINSWGELTGDGYYVSFSFYNTMAPKAWEAQIPNQTYTPSTTIEVGTFDIATQQQIEDGSPAYKYSYLHHIDSKTGVDKEFYITGGTVIVSEHENGQEVRFNLELHDGSRHLAKYTGYVRQGDEYTVTTLVNDREMQEANRGYIEYKGKTPMYGLENNRWNIYLASKDVTVYPSKYYWSTGGTGDFMRIGIYTTLDVTDDIPEGNYPLGKEIPGNAGEGSGLEAGLDFGTWFFELKNGEFKNYAPIKTGNVDISKEGDIYTISVTGKDDRDNTITATYTGTLEFSDATTMSTNSSDKRKERIFNSNSKKTSLYDWKKAFEAEKFMKRFY